MPTLDGQRMLLVEDDFFVAEEMCRSFEEVGASVIGPLGRVNEALAVVAVMAEIDGAVLDVNLHGEWVFPVADALLARAIPFVFTTGYDRSAIPARFGAVPLCEKPVRPLLIAKMLFGANDESG